MMVNAVNGKGPHKVSFLFDMSLGSEWCTQGEFYDNIEPLKLIFGNKLNFLRSFFTRKESKKVP